MTTESDDQYDPDATEALGAGINGAEEEPKEESQFEFEEMPSNAMIGDTQSDGSDSMESPGEAPAWSFGVIRILRVAVGIAVLFALLFDFQGAFTRIGENPEMMVLALAAVAQFIQIEDIIRLREMLGR